MRLMGAMLAEQHDEWPIVRRYMSLSKAPDTVLLDVSTTNAQKPTAVRGFIDMNAKRFSDTTSTDVTAR